MHVTLYGFILFLHIAVAIVAFMMAGVLHAALQALARARTVAETRSWANLVHRLDPLFPLAALLLLGFGAWLIQISGGAFAWSDGWLLTAVIALIVIEGLAGARVAPKAKATVQAIHDAADGPLPDGVRRLVLDPFVWHISHIATFGFTGVVFLMAAKPSGAAAVVVVVAGAVIGVAVSAAQLRGLAGAAGSAVPGQRREAETV